LAIENQTRATTASATPRAKIAIGTRIPGFWWKLTTGLWMGLLIVAAFGYVGPVLDGGRPMFTIGGHGAKAIFFHVPCAWLACLAYIVAAWYAGHYLRTLRQRGPIKSREDDFKCTAAMELGLLFAVLATITGSIFSHNEWGAYWSWDPRQTSILVVLLIFAAYLVLRGAIENPEARARLSSVYALVALVPGLFLIWVLPRIVPTLHEGPNRAVIGGGLGGSYRLVLYGLALPAFLALFIWLFQLRLRAMKVEARAQKSE
jgi:heme exporter protein C